MVHPQSSLPACSSAAATAAVWWYHGSSGKGTGVANAAVRSSGTRSLQVPGIWAYGAAGAVQAGSAVAVGVGEGVGCAVGPDSASAHPERRITANVSAPRRGTDSLITRTP